MAKYCISGFFRANLLVALCLFIAACGAEGSDEIVQEHTILGPVGGQVAVGQGVLTVPQGALAEPVEIKVAEVVPPRVNGFVTLGAFYRIMPDQLALDPPATLEMVYDSDKLPPGTSAADVRIISAHEFSLPWQALESSSTGEGRVQALVESFALFGPAVARSAADGDADTETGE